MPMEIKGVKGYFNDMRIDRDTVPEAFHFWELADGDSDGTPCRYKPGVLKNIAAPAYFCADGESIFIIKNGGKKEGNPYPGVAVRGGGDCACPEPSRGIAGSFKSGCQRDR